MTKQDVYVNISTNMKIPIDRHPAGDRSADIHTSVSDSVDALLAKVDPRIRERYEKNDGEQEDELIGKEIAFVDKVLSATMGLAESRSGPVTILFDVDETIARNVYGENGEITTYVRPGLDVLVKQLEEKLGDRFDIGLLTSRAESHLLSELESPTYTDSIKDRINPEFIFSSRKGSPIYDHEALAEAPLLVDWQEEATALRAIRKIIRPDLKELGEANDFSSIELAVERGHWYDGKLAILQHVADQNPDRGFVFVDDLPFPASIDPSHNQVRGVSLGKEGFYL